MAKTPPRHHEIPRLYLQGFSIPSQSFVWRFVRGKAFAPGANKSKSNPYRSGLKETALRGDGYAIHSLGKLIDYSYEQKLQQQEIKADQVLHKIRAIEAITFEEKSTFAHYIGLMQKRLQHRDIQATAIAKSIVESYPWDELKKRFALDGKFRLALQVPEIRERILSNEGLTKLLRESMIQPYQQAHAELASMTWTFNMAPKEMPFITSDNPVIYDEERGLLSSILIFPISTRVTLIAHRYPEQDMQYEAIKEEMAHKINMIIIGKAKREVYSSYPDQWILNGLEELNIQPGENHQ